MKFLLFADLHSFDEENLRKIIQDFDYIIFLGDISASTMKTILNWFPNKKSYAVLGNHDDKDLLNSVNSFQALMSRFESGRFPVSPLHLIAENLGECVITGFDGAVEAGYKKEITKTQEEAMEANIPAADILFSHETGYHYLSDDPVHEGFRVIDQYILEKQPVLHFFGHHHKDIILKKHTTICVGIYGCSIFDVDKKNILKIF